MKQPETLTSDEIRISDNIKKYYAQAKRNGLKQTLLAELLGVTQGAVSHLMNRRMPANTDMVLALTRVFREYGVNVNPEDIDPTLDLTVARGTEIPVMFTLSRRRPPTKVIPLPKKYKNYGIYGLQAAFVDMPCEYEAGTFIIYSAVKPPHIGSPVLVIKPKEVFPGKLTQVDYPEYIIERYVGENKAPLHDCIQERDTEHLFLIIGATK